MPDITTNQTTKQDDDNNIKEMKRSTNVHHEIKDKNKIKKKAPYR